MAITAFAMFYCMYRGQKLDNPDPPELAELKREIRIWERTKQRIQGVSGVAEE